MEDFEPQEMSVPSSKTVEEIKPHSSSKTKMGLVFKLGISSVFLPYYGYADSCNRLMRNLCKSTNELWEKYVDVFLESKIKKRKMFGIKKDDGKFNFITNI